MAALPGNNLASNYKGFINIGATINQNISSSLQYLTDGDGNNLPIQVSTTQVSIGDATGTGRLIVRGDGTNPIFRAENNSGVERFSIPNAGDITANSSISIPANNLFASGSASFSGTGSAAALYWGGTGSNGRVGVNSGGVFIDYGGSTKTNTSGTLSLATLTSAFGAAAGSANFRPLSINYTINNSGAQTGTMTGIYLNATETALNGMTHNLMDLQVGGVSAFKVQHAPSAIGLTTSGSYIAYNNNANQLVGIQLGVFYVFNSGVKFRIDLASNEARNLGNLFVGSISVATSARLHVRGDGTNPIVRFENSAGGERFSISDSGVINIATTSGSMTIAPGTSIAFTLPTFFASAGGLSFNLTSALSGAGTVSKLISNQTYTLTGASATNVNEFRWTTIYNLTANPGVVNIMDLSPTINQTGGANGITRGLYVNPTLTAAADFRAIEVRAGSTPAHKLLLLTDGSGNKVFEVNGKQQIGFYGASPSDKLDVTGSRANPEQALASLLTTLATYGIIVDSTTA